LNNNNNILNRKNTGYSFSPMWAHYSHSIACKW